MSVIDKARELALLIIETDEYKKLKEAEAKFETDEKSMQLMNEYQEIQNGMLAKLQADASQEEIEAEKTKLMDKQQEINDYEVTQEFLLARSGFEAMMQQVNEVIAYVVSGEEGCSPSQCATCGGGCGGAH